MVVFRRLPTFFIFDVTPASSCIIIITPTCYSQHNNEEAMKHTSHVVVSLYHLLNPQQPPCIHNSNERRKGGV